MRCCWSSAARVLTLLSLAFLSSHSLLLVNAQTTDAVDIPKPEDARSPTATSAHFLEYPSLDVEHSLFVDLVACAEHFPNADPVTLAFLDDTFASRFRVGYLVHLFLFDGQLFFLFVSIGLVDFLILTYSHYLFLFPWCHFARSVRNHPRRYRYQCSRDGRLRDILHLVCVGFIDCNRCCGDRFLEEDPSKPPLSVLPSFFDNKGAVAGTFSAAGVVIIGAIVIAIVFSRRRAARLQDEEDLTYFEKYEGPTSTNASAANDGSHTPTEPEMSYMGHGGAHGMDVNDEPLATYAAPDAYPDRTMHFGLPSMEEYAQPRAMGLDFGSAVDYPPEMSYNATQYAGYEGYNPTQYAGYDGGYAQTQQPYYASSYPAQTMPAHPYANPTNSPRMAGAPAVQLYGEAT
ncbi:hypothetical protein LXA43DRAFT_1098950 [Ganoderma leucocontextum]|nr:hypothetical protein LXA43DRAFT_1098950 [Ganoderma leucocontextum]